MSEADPLTIFPIDYADRCGQRRLFYVFPEAIRVEGGHRKLDFVIRTTPEIPPLGTDRIFQFDLEEIAGEWRIVMIGQFDGYVEYEKCGLPEHVILAVAEKCCLPIRSSSLKRPTQEGESRKDTATKVWDRLTELAATTDDWRVKYSEDEDVYRLNPKVKGQENQ